MKRTPLVVCRMLVESRKQARFVHWLLGLNNNQKMYNMISQLSGKYIERNHVFVGYPMNSSSKENAANGLNA